MTLSAPEMPERIWLIPDIGWDGETAWSNDPAPEPGMDPDNATEYLRKDLCAVCGAHPPQPSVTVAEAAKVLVAAWDADELPVSDPDPMLPEFIAALRALKGDSDD